VAHRPVINHERAGVFYNRDLGGPAMRQLRGTGSLWRTEKDGGRTTELLTAEEDGCGAATVSRFKLQGHEREVLNE
jgi:hypothetical protein